VCQVLALVDCPQLEHCRSLGHTLTRGHGIDTLMAQPVEKVGGFVPRHFQGLEVPNAPEGHQALSAARAVKEDVLLAAFGGHAHAEAAHFCVPQDLSGRTAWAVRERLDARLVQGFW
jgi:hypothetical protein